MFLFTGAKLNNGRVIIRMPNGSDVNLNLPLVKGANWYANATTEKSAGPDDVTVNLACLASVRHVGAFCANADVATQKPVQRFDYRGTSWTRDNGAPVANPYAKATDKAKAKATDKAKGKAKGKVKAQESATLPPALRGAKAKAKAKAKGSKR